MAKLLDVESSGIQTLYDKDEHTGKTIIKRVQDVEGVLDCNQRERNSNNQSWKGDLHKVASIPLVIWEQWIIELKRQGRTPNPSHPSNRKWLVAKLNSGDYGKLRTKDGTI